MKKIAISLFYILCLYAVAMAQKENKYLRSGNKSYESKAYTDADVSYRKALDANTNSFEGYFNLGDALYKQGQFSDAEVKYNRALQLANDDGSKALTFYNLGNAQLKQNKFKEAIETYKNALRLNPGDPDAIYNLTYAMHKLEEQQKGDQNQDNKENSDKDKKEENKDENENKEKGDGNNDENKNTEEKDGGQEKNDNEKGNDGKKNESKEGENKEQQSAEKAAGISPDDARKLLEALEGEEKKVQAKIMELKGKGKKLKAEKEW